MQVVIDIDENLFTRLFDCEGHSVIDMLNVCTAVRKGTPLPKGHKRLIEDNFKVGPVFDKEGNRIGYQYITQEDLNNAQTIIEEDKESE